MTEDRRADRASDEADEVGAEGGERRRERVLIREIELAEDEADRGAVDEEVVPFDRRADRRRDDGFAKLCVVLGFRQSPVTGHGGHWNTSTGLPRPRERASAGAYPRRAEDNPTAAN